MARARSETVRCACPMQGFCDAVQGGVQSWNVSERRYCTFRRAPKTVSLTRSSAPMTIERSHLRPGSCDNRALQKKRNVMSGRSTSGYFATSPWVFLSSAMKSGPGVASIFLRASSGATPENSGKCAPIRRSMPSRATRSSTVRRAAFDVPTMTCGQSNQACLFQFYAAGGPALIALHTYAAKQSNSRVGRQTRSSPRRPRACSSVRILRKHPADIPVPIAVVMVDQLVRGYFAGLDAFLQRVEEMGFVRDQTPCSRPSAGLQAGP